MSTPALLAALVALYLPTLMLPGPNFLAVTRAALDAPPRHALATALGVASGSTLWAAMAAAGVGWLLAHGGPLQRAIALLGASYLLVVAHGIWRQASATSGAALARQADAGSLAASFRAGLLTNLTNPKALVFFATIFTALLGVGSSSGARVLAVVVVCALSSAWHIALATLFTHARVRSAYGRARPLLLRTTSLLLGGFGLRLAWSAASGR